VPKHSWKSMQEPRIYYKISDGWHHAHATKATAP
jgi:hypothetical protein